MPMASSAELGFYSLYSPCLVMVESTKPDGHVGVGTAFHIGDGYLVTARHVIEGRSITKLEPADPGCTVDLESVKVMYPSDKTVDLALIESNFSTEAYMSSRIMLGDAEVTNKIDHIQIGGHLDDWIDDGLILFEVVVFGYPPIPTSSRPHLVAVRGQVNAIIDPYVGSKNPLFVISPMPRGGFSGGPVLTCDGWLLGVMTTSLINNYSVPEIGFGAALTVEPLWHLLLEHGVSPASNAEFLNWMKYGWGTDGEAL